MEKDSPKIIFLDSQKIKLRATLEKCFPGLSERQKEWKEGAEQRRKNFIQKAVETIENNFFELLIYFPDKEVLKTGVSLSLNPNEGFYLKGGRSYQLRENLELDDWLAEKGFLEVEKRLQQKYPEFRIGISLIRVDTDKVNFTHVQVGFKINLKKSTNNRCQIYHLGGENKFN